jgi:hypothetical protein
VSKYLSREFLQTLIVAVAGIVGMFVDVDDSLVTQIVSGAVALGAVITYAVARTKQKAAGM